MTKFYDKEVDLPTTLAVDTFRNIVVHTDPFGGGNDSLFEVYYKDSEWPVALSGAGMDQAVFGAATVGFDDGIDWRVRSSITTMTTTIQFIVVRKSDRKTILFHADADGTTIADATWTFTDVTGEVWHEGLRKLRILGFV